MLALLSPILLLLLFLSAMLHWLRVLAVCVQVTFFITLCKYVLFIWCTCVSDWSFLGSFSPFGHSVACRASGHWDSSREISQKAPWGELLSGGEGRGVARERWWRATFLYNRIFIWRISRKIHPDLWSWCAKWQLRHRTQGAERQKVWRDGGFFCGCFLKEQEVFKRRVWNFQPKRQK